MWLFHFTQEVKSFITHPSFGQTLKGTGFYEVSGIAYSGNGRIAKVMVSADGGKSWAQAALEEPLLPKAFTRFRMPWRWDGTPAVREPRLGRSRQRAAHPRRVRCRARADREAGGEPAYLPISLAIPILTNNLRKPDSQVYRFIGRDKELSDLWRWLSNPYALVKVVSGFGGLGKTTSQTV